jgi:hypothetical protein
MSIALTKLDRTGTVVSNTIARIAKTATALLMVSAAFLALLAATIAVTPGTDALQMLLE